MKRFSLLTASALLLSSCLVGAAFAQSADPYTVHFKLEVNQPTLFDNKAFDSFKGTVDDSLGITAFNWLCSAGQKGFIGIGRSDEKCAFDRDHPSYGQIRNPKNPQQVAKRINFGGGYTIEAKKDGYTDVSTITANYVQLGGAGAQNSTFGGSVLMMPENPTAGALELAGKLFDNIKEKAGGTSVEFDTQIDTITFSDFVVPNVGQAGSTSCSWSGPALFAYANNSWQMDLTIKCGNDNPLHLAGNMALVDAPAGSDYDQEYQINLVLPDQGNGDPFGAADPFATVPGITGTLKLDNSGRDVDGVFEKVVVTGDITGNSVAPEAVRGYGEILLVFARTFFGA